MDEVVSFPLAATYAAGSEQDPRYEVPPGWDEDRNCWANRPDYRNMDQTETEPWHTN